MHGGDTLNITLTYNRYFDTSAGDYYPNIKLLNEKDEVKRTLTPNDNGVVTNETDKTTTITYTYTVTSYDNFKIDKLSIEGKEGQTAKETTWAKGENDNAVGVKGVKAVIPVEIIVDTTEPELKNVKAYVDEKLETSRYTAEKEVLFELTISEIIDEIETTKPDIEVSFSKSGRGLYNYSTDEKKAGFAKYRSDLTRENEDGTYTMVYSYKIQEGDEGNLTFNISDFTLYDPAGNVADIGNNSSTIKKADNWIDYTDQKIEDMDISYKVYKGNEEITEKLEVGSNESFSIVFTFDKILYASVTETDPNFKLPIKFENGYNSSYLPSLKLNGLYGADRKNIKYEDGKTIITYTFSAYGVLNSGYLLDIGKTRIISGMKLANDCNESIGDVYELEYEGVKYDVGGSTPYSEYDFADKDNAVENADDLNYISKDAYINMLLDFNIIIKGYNDVVNYDIDDIYADTTSPTVKITTDKKDPTNASEIKYTFEFSESVRDFTEEDIAVNGGTIVKDSFKKIESESKLGDEYGLKYEVIIKPLAQYEEEGILQVIIEKGACIDQVAKENVRQESNIKIDKVKPVFESYSIKFEDSKLIGRFVYSEVIWEGFIEMSLNIGGKSIDLVRDINQETGEKVEDYNYTLEADEENPNTAVFTYYKDPSDGGKVEAIYNILYMEDLAGNRSEEKWIELEEEIILEQTEIKSETDENVSYTFEKNGEGINSFSQPTYFKKGDTLTVIKHEEIEVENEGKKEKQDKTTNYEYTITEEDVKKFQSNSNPVQITNIELFEPTKTGGKGSLTIVNIDQNYSVNTTEAKIYYDVIEPEVELSIKVNEPNINNIYTKGEELTIIATTSEAIKDTEAPEIRVSFTNSGIGKYNDGNANYQETITNENGTTTWIYKYIAQNGDDGKAIIEYAKEKKILDLAENEKTLKTYPAVNKGDINLTDIEIGENTKVSFEIYKNNEKIENFTNNTYFANEDSIRVVAKFDKLIYGAYNDDERNLLNKNTAPILKMKDKTFEVEEELVNNKNVAKIEHDKAEYKTTITYIYEVKAEDEETQLTNLSLSSGDKLVALHKELKETEEETEEKEEITVTKEIEVNISKDITNCNLHIYNSSTIVSGREITVDTIKPNVSIKAQYEVPTEEGEIIYNTIKGPTNLEKILYTFEFSEEIEGFDIDDITVNGGTKGTLQEETPGKVYKLEITPDVADGNEGNVQVIVEKDSCTDKAGYGNIRAENNVKVDRKAPTLLGLEAYAPTDSNVILNEKINIEQEYYKTNATLKIVATFDESVTTEAKLSLQFGEEKAKGKVIQEGTTGNKITYTYKIVDGDEGKLSIASYRGKALDSAGNEITVTKRELSGDTIIADTTAPTLKELKVVSPGPEITETEKAETETTEIEKPKTNNKYKAGNKVTIEAIFDEEIYVIEENEIKLIDTHIEVKNEEETEEGKEPEITITNNAPTLIIKFGNGEEREAIVEGYGKTEEGKVDRTKIIYTYTIVEEHTEKVIQEIDGKEKEVEILCSGDNGELKVVSYKNKENVEVCDLAGNVAKLGINLTGNKIIADTIPPKVEKVWAEVKEPIIQNTDIYHKAENVATIYVKFDEEVEAVSQETKPQIKVFGKKIECDEILEDGVTAKFTYKIEDGDNGYLRITVPGAQFKDMAGNENVQEYYLQDGDKEIEKYWDCEDVYADTEAPYLSMNESYKSEWKIEYEKNSSNQVTKIIATGIFNEKIFSMKDNTITKLEKAPMAKLFINGGEQNRIIDARIETTSDGRTKLVYKLDAGNIDTAIEPTLSIVEGTVYDRAGNQMSLKAENDGDISSPIFKDIKVVTPNGFYKAGDDIEIIARFKEQTRLTTVPVLKVKLGDKEITLNGAFDPENTENTDTIKIAKYTYKIQDGDDGALNIISLIGKVHDGARGREISLIYLDEEKDDVEADEDVESKEETEESKINADPETLLNSEEKQYANTQEEYKNVIADTKDPYVSKVEVKVNGNVIASYTKEEGKDAVVNVGRSNDSELEYIFTFSELVSYDTDETEIFEPMIYNGVVKEIKDNDTNKDGCFNQLTIKVKPYVEGVQSLIMQNKFKDRSGKSNIAERFNLVTTDLTKPIIRVISEYNGGIYVLPTNIGKVETRPNVEVNEEICKIEYKWDDEEYKEIEHQSTSSDITIPTKSFTEAGTHVLSIRVTDLAGNVAETSKTYEIKASNINVTVSTEEWTNKDITVTVEFGEGLTDNRKVIFKSETTGETVQLNAIGTDENGKTQYTITENGTLYAEATDKVGNKVFTERTITNIDKEAPTVEIDLNSADLVIGTGKDNATIKTDVAVNDNKVLDYAKFDYIQKDIDVANISDEDKALITTKLNAEAKIENAESTMLGTPYYLYVIAKDKAGNETIAKAGPFTVRDTNERELLPVEPNSSWVKVPAEIEENKLIAFEQEGNRFNITYNNFGEGEQYLNIIREKEITLTKESDGKIDNEKYSYVDISNPTTITVIGKDACGNEVIVTKEVTKDNIEGPKLEITGNTDNWTNTDIKLEVECDKELSSLTVNGKDILSKDNNVKSNTTVTQNGNYTFIGADKYGRTSQKTVKVTKIDKDKPTITDVKVSGKTITITAEDELSGVAKYAITETTTTPGKWNESNIIKVTNDGTYYVWVMDNAGNISRAEKTVIVETSAPTISFNYTLLTVETGTPINVNIVTDKNTKISYSWDNKNWTTSKNFITNVNVTKKYDVDGKYTLYAKATDEYGNESGSFIEFTVVKPQQELEEPQIEFEELFTTQINGIHYVKISSGMTLEDVTNKMNKKALCNVAPEYKNLTEDGKLKTGSEITLNGDTKYLVIVNGDVNCDGKVTFDDIIKANSIRITETEGSITKAQLLAADINNSAKIEFKDIISINAIRINSRN